MHNAQSDNVKILHAALLFCILQVVDFGKDGVHKTYLVHYAGWNTRFVFFFFKCVPFHVFNVSTVY